MTSTTRTDPESLADIKASLLSSRTATLAEDPDADTRVLVDAITKIDAYEQVERPAAEARMAALQAHISQLQEQVAAIAAEQRQRNEAAIAEWHADPLRPPADAAMYRAHQLVATLLEIEHRLRQRVTGEEVPDIEVERLIAEVDEHWQVREGARKPERVLRVRFLSALETAKGADNPQSAFTKAFGPHGRASQLRPSDEVIDEALALWRRNESSRGEEAKWPGLAAILARLGLGECKGSSLRRDWGYWSTGEVLR